MGSDSRNVEIRNQFEIGANDKFQSQSGRQMNEDDYDPQSSVPSPPLTAFVNGKSGNALFVYILKHQISAMIYREGIINKANIQMGDFASVIIKYNPKSNENHASRHEVLDAIKLTHPPSIVKSSPDVGGAMLKVIARKHKDAIFNDFIGELYDNFNYCSTVQSGKDIHVLVQVKHLKIERIHGFVVRKYLGPVGKDRMDEQILKKESKGLIRGFNGFTCTVWSPDYQDELKIASKELKMDDFLGRWILFDQVKRSDDGSLRIVPESIQELSCEPAAMRTVDSGKEFELSCEGRVTFHEQYDDYPKLKLSEGGLAIDLMNVLNENQNLDIEFPKKLWFLPSSDASCPWKLSPNNPSLNRPDEPILLPSPVPTTSFSLASPSPSSFFHKGLILRQEKEFCDVYCPQYIDILLMKLSALRERSWMNNLAGKWISFYENDVNQEIYDQKRFMIKRANLIEPILPTVVNVQLDYFEVKVNCTDEKVNNEYANGCRVFCSDFIGSILDVDFIIHEEEKLPFAAWVRHMMPVRENPWYRWRIVRLDDVSSNCNTPPLENALDEEEDSVPNTAATEEISLTSYPTISDCTAAPAVEHSPTVHHTTPRTAMHCHEMFMQMVDDEAGGIYSEDETELPKQVQTISNEQNQLSRELTEKKDYEIEEDDADREVEEILEPRPIETPPLTMGQSSSPYREMSLEELGHVLLENRELCAYFELLNRPLYHAFASKIFNG